MIYYSPLFSEAAGCGGLKLKPDVSPNENDPAPKFTGALPSCSGLLNTKPDGWELSVLVTGELDDDDTVELKPKDAAVHAAAGLKLKPTTR